MATSNWGAVVSIDQDKSNDNSYTIKQSKLQSPFAPLKSGNGDNLRDSISFGPFNFDFTIDKSNGKFGVSVSVLGIGIGNFYGSFSEGLVVNVNLIAASGTMRFYVQNSALYVDVKIHVLFPSYDYDETYEITSWKLDTVQPRTFKL